MEVVVNANHREEHRTDESFESTLAHTTRPCSAGSANLQITSAASAIKRAVTATWTRAVAHGMMSDTPVRGAVDSGASPADGGHKAAHR